ncbi:unnamed protein product [Phytophthora fragariaefolia]|uniref:Unnamed protein product n=1 Tax=Phytophthora fragariaefolia TaxID=1490495 RepID=A0A9W6X9V2_9STRA|nr:unnamed protein product [Phytophthora fragariaefolia]
MDGIPRCPDERTRASGGRCAKDPSVVHRTLEWIPGVGPVQYHGTDAEGEQEEDLVSEVTMESIEENEEHFDDTHALGEAFPPDEGEGGGQCDQAADNPPWPMKKMRATQPVPAQCSPTRNDQTCLRRRDRCGEKPGPTVGGARIDDECLRAGPCHWNGFGFEPSTRSFDDAYDGWALGAESSERGQPARPDDKCGRSERPGRGQPAPVASSSREWRRGDVGWPTRPNAVLGPDWRRIHRGKAEPRRRLASGDATSGPKPRDGVDGPLVGYDNGA